MDGHNKVPVAFYATEFLEQLSDHLLAPCGVVIHNFHSGDKTRASQLEQAGAAYSSVFAHCVWVEALDSKPNAGNMILLASHSSLGIEGNDSSVLRSNALAAQIKYKLRFDAPARVQGVTPIII